MTRSLIALPIRLGLRSAEVAVRGVAAVAGHALGVVGRLAGAMARDGGPEVDIDGSPHEGREHSGKRQAGPRTQSRRRQSPSDGPARARAKTSRQRGPRSVRPPIADEPTAEAQAPPAEAEATPAETEAPPAAEAQAAPAEPEAPPAEAEAPPAAEAQAAPAEPEAHPDTAPPPETERPPEAAMPSAGAPQPPAPGLGQTPIHVSEEPVLVDEVAERGAEDGVGPEIHVAEPWDGYHQLDADDVIDRITGA